MEDDSVVSGLKKKKNKPRRRIIFIAFFVVVAVSAVSLAGWLVVFGPRLSLLSNKQEQPIGDKAAKLAHNGKAKDAIKLYDSQLSLGVTKEEKYSLLNGRVAICINEGLYQEALVDTKSMYELQKNENSASLLAQVYEELGQKEDAIKYYKKAIDLADDQPNGGSKDYYNYKIMQIENNNEEN